MVGLPPILVEQVRQRRCALFLGPDVAESARGLRGLPTSWQLADELAMRCGYRGGYRPLPQIAQIYEHSRGRHDLVSYLSERMADPVYKPLPLHEIVARMNFPVVVQAGWDRLLERSLDGQGVNYRVVKSVVDIPYAVQSNGLLLYKPYGGIDEPASLVITEDDQLNVLYQLRTLTQRLADLLSSYAILLIGYASNYDSVLVRLYHDMRQELGPHRPPAFIVHSTALPGDAAQWEARGIQPLYDDPVTFLFQLAEAVAQAEGHPVELPDPATLSEAEPITEADMARQTETLNRVLDMLGVSDLIEQTDVPLLSPEQVNDLEAMRASYERLSESLAPGAEAAQVWLRQGNIEYARQNFETACAYYERALSIQPDLAEAHHNLHYVYLAENRLDDAFSAYARATALRPDFAILPSRYRIDKVLGRGGAGIVYRAVDTASGEQVAVKVLDRAFMRTERMVRRFRREGEILQRLRHPHIVRLLDFDHYQGRYFIAMEYLGDVTLATKLNAQKQLTLDETIELLRQMCDGIGFAHSQHIIHRDLKPSNIFLVDGGVKIIDFGLAADLQAGQPSIADTSGTYAYMAPEQMMGEPIDERSDLYALATLVYEMLTGMQPGQGAYRPASELVSGLTPVLDLALDKARQRNPADRYASVAAFRAEIDAIAPMQPASRLAPGWLRGLARLQQFIVWLTGPAWWLSLLIILGVGIVLPLLWPSGPLNLTLAIATLLLWDMLIMVNVMQWFTSYLARRNSTPLLALFTPLLGAIIGPMIGLTVYFAFTHVQVRLIDDPFDYVASGLMVQAVAVLVLGAFSLLLMASGVGLGQRLRLGPRGRVALAYALALLPPTLLLLYALQNNEILLLLTPEMD